jgi:hypothetical protein
MLRAVNTHPGLVVGDTPAQIGEQSPAPPSRFGSWHDVVKPYDDAEPEAVVPPAPETGTGTGGVGAKTGAAVRGAVGTTGVVAHAGLQLRAQFEAIHACAAPVHCPCAAHVIHVACESVPQLVTGDGAGHVGGEVKDGVGGVKDGVGAVNVMQPGGPAPSESGGRAIGCDPRRLPDS